MTVNIDLLLKLLIAASELIVGVESFIELVLLQLDLVRVSLDHDLLNLILLNVLVDSILLASLEGWELIETVSSGAHIITIKRDTESLTDLRVIDVKDVSSFLLLELLLGGLNLSSEYHQAPKFSRYKISIQFKFE